MRGAAAEWLRAETGAEKLGITGAKLLSGGAIQENWQLDLAVLGGRLDGVEQVVLRTDAASGVDESHGRVEEFRPGCIVSARPAPIWISSATLRPTQPLSEFPSFTASSTACRKPTRRWNGVCAGSN